MSTSHTSSTRTWVIDEWSKIGRPGHPARAADRSLHRGAAARRLRGRGRRGVSEHRQSAARRNQVPAALGLRCELSATTTTPRKSTLYDRMLRETDFARQRDLMRQFEKRVLDTEAHEMFPTLALPHRAVPQLRQGLARSARAITSTRIWRRSGSTGRQPAVIARSHPAVPWPTRPNETSPYCHGEREASSEPGLVFIPGAEIVDSAVSGDRHGGRRPAIHVFADHGREETWMPTCVGMTIPLPLKGHRKGRLVLGVLRRGNLHRSAQLGWGLLPPAFAGVAMTVVSVARFGREWGELEFVGPARPVLGVQVPERLGDLHRIDHEIGSVLHPRHRPRAG